MGSIANRLGKRYGKLTVIEMLAKRSPDRQVMWLCKCDCGNLFEEKSGHLGSGHTRSCGCAKGKWTHGKSRIGSPAYAAWRNMLGRCYGNQPASEHYRSRGIVVCKRWRNSFENFLADMGERPGKGISLDRKNNNKGYSKSNCRWATIKQQVNNTSNNLPLVSFHGKKKSVMEWSKETGISYSAIRSRIFILGWSIQDALTYPVDTTRTMKYKRHSIPKKAKKK